MRTHDRRASVEATTADDALAVADGLEDAAKLCSPLQAALAARLRVGAETIRTQQRRLDAAVIVAKEVRKQLHQLAERM
jgi:hypothetical protein